jgi:hypothetical protein
VVSFPNRRGTRDGGKEREPNIRLVLTVDAFVQLTAANHKSACIHFGMEREVIVAKGVVL